MRRISLALIVILLILSALLPGCRGVVTGSGNLQTEQYSLTDFTSVEVSSAFKFEITQSTTYSVQVTADDNIADKVEVSKEGNTLKIGLQPLASLGPVTLKATVAMPLLRGLDASGASSGTISNFSSTENFDLVASGASNVSGDISAANSDFNISGASTVQLKGSCTDLFADVSGASHLDLEDFPVQRADIEVSGASTGTINVSGRLDADLSGASSVKYIGNPTMGDITTTGSSSLKPK